MKGYTFCQSFQGSLGLLLENGRMTFNSLLDLFHSLHSLGCIYSSNFVCFINLFDLVICIRKNQNYSVCEPTFGIGYMTFSIFCHWHKTCSQRIVKEIRPSFFYRLQMRQSSLHQVRLVFCLPKFLPEPNRV